MSFNPYEQNGGTVVGISGPDFAILAADTRMSVGYSIYTRNNSKAYPLTPRVVLGTAGFHGDVLTLTKSFKSTLRQYKQAHGREPTIVSIAQRLANILYGKRFFPYYTNNILVGVDEQGAGYVYSYDPVGSYERESYRAAGSGSALLQPLLDNQIGLKNQQNPDRTPLTKERAVAMVKDIFTGAGERDIYTGDSVEIVVVTAAGITTEIHQLRRD